MASLRQSKRKRAQVDYCEGGSDLSDADDGYTPRKRKTLASRPLPKRSIFPFLKLPAEIRNLIYGYCLQDPAGIFLTSTTQMYRRTVCRESERRCRGLPRALVADPGDDEVDAESTEYHLSVPSHGTRHLVPALLAVCKQINTEARDILYGQNFCLKDTLTMHSFLVDLGPRAASYLKNVELVYWGAGRGVNKAYNHAAFTALSAATNLDRFTFRGFLTPSKRAKDQAISFYRDAFPWLEAVAVAKGKVDAAVRLLNVLVPEEDYRNGWYPPSVRGRRFGGEPAFKPHRDLDGFRSELGKLLNDRMDKIRY